MLFSCTVLMCFRVICLLDLLFVLMLSLVCQFSLLRVITVRGTCVFAISHRHVHRLCFVSDFIEGLSMPACMQC